MINLLTKEEFLSESYDKIDNYWCNVWEELRETDPGRFTHLKAKFELTDDQITKPNELPSGKKAMILPDIATALTLAKRYQNKKNTPL